MNYFIFDGIIKDIRVSEDGLINLVRVKSLIDQTELCIACKKSKLKKSGNLSKDGFVVIWGHFGILAESNIECDGFKILKGSPDCDEIGSTKMSDEAVKAYIEKISKKVGFKGELLN
ncbi:hypothetical protein [Lactiplantibacillus plantarum]|uniref:hypothetical protein n=1 Tax=Lactiplantibacillus plantarum TaxID=1590 RepID=UPI001BADEE43|nr:hypothetical protein [Lactiplantibacillus plantarum]MBS0954986.1 hypothetical protein [Lactiplantibacillus plantarum]